MRGMPNQTRPQSERDLRTTVQPRTAGAVQAKAAGTQDSASSAAHQSVGKKVISDISGAQITASALAAVTSLFFSSNIGLAGSVIGVAASAAVTALSSSIYKSFIEGTKAKAKAKAAENEALASGEGTAEGAPQTTQEFKREAFTNNEAAVSRNSGKYTHAAAKRQSNGVSGRFDIVNKKWFAIVLLTVIGLLTVFVTAHIITTATGGEGIGTKTTPIFQTSEKVDDDMSTASLDTSHDSEPSSESMESSASESDQSQEQEPSSSSAADTGAYDTASSSSSANVASSSSSAAQSVSSSSVSDTTVSSSSVAQSAESSSASSSTD